MKEKASGSSCVAGSRVSSGSIAGCERRSWLLGPADASRGLRERHLATARSARRIPRRAGRSRMGAPGIEPGKDPNCPPLQGGVSSSPSASSPSASAMSIRNESPNVATSRASSSSASAMLSRPTAVGPHRPPYARAGHRRFREETARRQTCPCAIATTRSSRTLTASAALRSASGSWLIESRVALLLPAPLLSRSITPFALFGRCQTLSLGGLFIPVSPLAHRHLANDEPSRGQLLTVTLEPGLALVPQLFPVRSGHALLLPRGKHFYTSIRDRRV